MRLLIDSARLPSDCLADGTTGNGRCYFRTDLGQYSSNSSVYAGAELLSNGTPRLPCPYYNGTTFTDTQGYQWQVRCGFDTTGTDTGTALLGGYNMTDCFGGRELRQRIKPRNAR